MPAPDTTDLCAQLSSTVANAYSSGLSDQAAADTAAINAAVQRATDAEAGEAQAKLDLATYVSTHPDPTTPPGGGSKDLATPAGYKPFYVHDFAADGDDGKWAITTGTAGNNAAHFVKACVNYVSGKGQVLNAYDDGTTIYSGRVQANIKVPTFGYWRWISTVVGFGVGAWPSLWARGDDSIGEIDLMEMFGGHIGNKSTPLVCKGTAILTGPSNAYNQGSASKTYDTAIPKAQWGSEHMYEMVWDAKHIEFMVDQKSVGAISAADLDATSKNKATYTYAKQFANATRTWHLRADAQAGNLGTHTDAGEWVLGKGQTFSQTQRGVGIYVPA